MGLFRRREAVAVAALMLAAGAVYANHFGNGFHFDDFHTITNNPAIRDLANLPRFFSDAATFSVEPGQESYRPLVTASLALDYRLAGGLRPLWFQVSTFFWFVVLLGTLYLLFEHLMERARPGPLNPWMAWVAAALFGLHPAAAQTVNYIVQRADVYVALGLAAGVTIYARLPRLRRYGLYLVPPLGAILAKATALIFAPMLLAYILLFDRGRRESPVWPLLRAVPAFVLCGAGVWLHRTMTPPSFNPGALLPAAYRITQPYVALRFFRSFFVPLYLTGDSGMQPLPGWTAPAVWGAVFCLLVLAAALWTARPRVWRPVSFGLWWFLLGLVPTAVFPLSDVENDHRMFLPFIGLSLAVVWAAALALGLPSAGRRRACAAGATAAVALAALGWGTWRRNEVWRTEETFWRDVTEKSPGNFRGLLNYGVTLDWAGQPELAYRYFVRSAAGSPGTLLEVNLGIASGALGRDAEAETHFRRGIQAAAGDPQSYTYFAGWLYSRGRTAEALEMYRHAADLDRSNLDSRYGLMDIDAAQGNWKEVAASADHVLALSPDDPVAAAYQAMAEDPGGCVPDAEKRARSEPTPARWLALSLAYLQAARYDDAIRAARRLLALDPESAEAWNAIAAAERSRGRWDAAIAAARRSLHLKPSLALALNNLTWALARKP